MKRLAKLLGLIIVLTVASVQASQAQESAANKPFQTHKITCEFESVVFESQYETGRISACEDLNDGHYLITTLPENRPINPSPWYGFSVKSTQALAHQIRLSIQAEQSRPRYLPKISQDKQNWQALNFEVADNNLVIELTVGESIPTQYISAQEVLDTSFYRSWNRDVAKASAFELFTIGRSVEGRGIEALVHQQADNKEWLLIIGRQHPPEITGALALLGFVDALIEPSEATTALFDRFNILLVPLVNPDGVAAGNWRHNVNGIDLNRDWGKFTQPETLAVHDKLKALMQKDHRLVFALDFHSTQQDIFYTMPTDYIPIIHKSQNIDAGVAPSLFVEEWLEDVKQQSVRSFTLRDRPGSSPGRGVFKQFIADEYGVHAVTYEVGDNTNRALIKHVAQQAAETLVTKLLATPQADFIVAP